MRVAKTTRRAKLPGVFRLSPIAACLILPALAWGQYVPQQPKFDTYSDFGGIGLLQMPTARFSEEGAISISTGLVEPYQRTAVTFQPLPWLEGTLRYTAVRNRLYGPQDFSGKQNYKDRGIDLKFLLLEESKYLPQVAVGFRDVGGTGLFSSEYLTISRRYYNFDFSLGMGWGNLGTRAHVKNPFGFISDRFKSRPSNAGTPGSVSSISFFQGEMVSLFGGITYQTPIPGLTLKLEYDGNDYSQEALNNPQKVRSPINIGAVYSYSDWLDFSVGYERGDKLMAQVALRGNIHKVSGMPKNDPTPEAIQPRNLNVEINDYLKKQEQNKPSNTLLRMSESLGQLDYQIESVQFRGKEMIATVAQPTFRNRAKAIGRAARAMANAAPADIELLTIVDLQNGVETQHVSLMRKDLEKAVRHEGSPEEMAKNLRVTPPENLTSDHRIRNDSLYPSASWGWAPAMRHHIGGPDDPYFYEIYLRGFADLQLTRNFSLSGEINVNVKDNFDGLRLASDSVLPHVRSDIKEYLKEGSNGITLLQADYQTNLGSESYARVSAGLFEDMFGGIGGELLYKPFGQRWAIGADLYRVRQRDYDRRFAFRDYEVTTGHVDLYYQLPFYDITAQLSIGQYLAGDRGATLTLSRRFESGAEFGVFATKTNISAAEFGEGSFDKGAYITVPFDLLSYFSNRSFIGIGWRPLTRDGGQRLHQSKRLYPIVAGSGRDAMLADWSKVLD